ncbi:MAG: 3-oxo-tetronate kinase [Woeseiaceae bacterium]|nr:3-oxo-tetronate kinase [Woeseiaceae bacterium]
MSLLVGCIADDITGGSDIGSMLASRGMPVTLCLGTPGAEQEIESPAVVIALKIRTVPADVAVRQAGKAARWLIERGARQLYYKYCSTFDSTPRGNIGPVTEALMRLARCDLTVLVPAFPDNGRTVVDGQLLVNGTPLSESPMRYHPLTPMSESSLVTMMDAQTRAGTTTHVPLRTVREGAAAIRAQFEQQRRDGFRFAAIDAETNADLDEVGEACADLRLVTGAAGLAGSLPSALRRRSLMETRHAITELPSVGGYAAVLAGSCSEATRSQVRAFSDTAASFVIDPLRIANEEIDVASLSGAAVAAAASSHVIVYSTTDPEALRRVQAEIGVAESAAIVESVLAAIARDLADAGVRKFVVAGGETSGSVAAALQLGELAIGPQIDPGVPWMISRSQQPTCLAFKSGNFGAVDFFEKAIGMLP